MPSSLQFVDGDIAAACFSAATLVDGRNFSLVTTVFHIPPLCGYNSRDDTFQFLDQS
jgi:hypothetical protein